MTKAIAFPRPLQDLATAAQVSVWALYKIESGQRCGPALARRIEQATGGAISRSDLRPDLWPPLADEQAREAPAAVEGPGESGNQGRNAA